MLVYYMVSIEKNSEIVNILGNSCMSTFDCGSVKLSGARSRLWLDVGARIAPQ